MGTVFYVNPCLIGEYIATCPRPKNLAGGAQFLSEYSLGTAQILSNISSLFDRFHRFHSRNKYENIPEYSHAATLSPQAQRAALTGHRCTAEYSPALGSL